MEKFFDHVLDVIKHLEVKAQEKSQRKKYWVLGKQYIQPVDDVDEGRKCLDHDLKKKAKCVYQAAKGGMKEGVLTGIFLGGFYGLIKNLNANVGNALMPSSLSKVNSSVDGGDQNVKEENLTEEEEDSNKNTVQSGNNNNQPRSDFKEPIVTRDNALKNKKRGKSTFTKSQPSDRGRNDEIKTERRASSAEQSANDNLLSVENVRPYTVTNVGNNRSKLREKEKVEIVSYAFVETLRTNDSDSSGNTASDDSDKRKGDGQKKEDEKKAQNRSELKDRVNSNQSGRSSGSNYRKNVAMNVEELHRRDKPYKKDGDRRKREEPKLHSSSSSSHESYAAQILLDTKLKANVEGNTSEKRNLVTQRDEKNEKKSEWENQKDTENNDQSTSVEGKQKVVSDKGKMGFNKGSKKSVSKVSRHSNKAKESADTKSESKRVEKSNKTKIRFSKSEKGSVSNKQKKSEGSKSKAFNYENFYYPKKISKSILVDADNISNGYSLSLNSNDESAHVSESNLIKSDASGHRMRPIIGQDTVTNTQPKKFFDEPEILSLSEEPSLRTLATIKKDSSNSQSADSTGSSSELGQASHTRKDENLKEPIYVQSTMSLNIILEENQAGSAQSVKPPCKSIISESTRSSDLNDSTSPKAMSIGDSAAAKSFVQNDGFSNEQSKEFCDDKNSDTGIVGSELTPNKVRSEDRSELTSKKDRNELTSKKDRSERTSKKDGSELISDKDGSELTPNKVRDELTPNKDRSELTPNKVRSDLTSNEDRSELTSNEDRSELTSDKDRSDLTPNKVKSVKESAFSGTPETRYHLLQNYSDSLILLSACNCAVVLGVLCAVISTTRASLSF